MKPNELVEELNFFAKNSYIQSEENIEELYVHYASMFLVYCGVLPQFEITDKKGSIKLL